MDKPKIEPTGVKPDPNGLRSNSMFLHLDPGPCPGCGRQTPSGEFLLFVDSRTVDLDRLRQTKLPAGVSIEIVPLTLAPSQSLAEAIAIEKLNRLDATQKKEWDEGVGLNA